MTRKEAINIISQMIKDEEGFLSDNTVEAHKMAIKALENQDKMMELQEVLTIMAKGLRSDGVMQISFDDEKRMREIIEGWNKDE